MRMPKALGGLGWGSTHRRPGPVGATETGGSESALRLGIVRAPRDREPADVRPLDVVSVVVSVRDRKRPQSVEPG